MVINFELATSPVSEPRPASVAVFEHTDRIIQTAVGLCTNLNRHGFPTFSAVPTIVADQTVSTTLKRPEGHEVWFRFSDVRAIAHNPWEHKNNTALRRTGFRGGSRARAHALTGNPYAEDFLEFAGAAFSFKL